jgi:curved DNA-binding protein CbpA
VNPYDILQVSPLADDGVIRAAYRSLMQRYHPDRNPGDTQAAEAAARITQAYDLLVDPERRAAFDNAQRTMQQTSLHGAQKRSPLRQPATAREPQPSRMAWILRGAALLVCALLVWITFRAWPAGSGSPDQQLADIRLQIESPATKEAERRKLFEQKQSLLLQHAHLFRADSALRVNDLAQRSVALLTDPIGVNLAPVLAAGLPSVRLIVPEITLVLGSFDAVRLREHIVRHRQRIVDDLTQKLAAQSASFPLVADADTRLKRVIVESVMASLEIRIDEKYPSTYFESPGRHGVVDVILPQSFAALK